MGPPMPGALEAVRKLVHSGHMVYVLTARNEFDHIHEWLKYYDFPINYVTNVKDNSDIYIDDKGYHFTTWKKTLEDLDDLLK